MAAILTGRLTLEDFILEMSHVPSPSLTLGQLTDLWGRLDLSDALVDDNIHFASGAYTRNLVCRTPRFDMLVLCWRPGHVTTVHDHQGSLNVTRVYAGSLTSRVFETAGEPEPGRILVKQCEEDQLSSGGFACLDRGGIHQLANTSDQDLVTVHLYARPLRDIRVYSPQTGEVQNVTLRYTLEDEFA